jgi:hypothetical protein
LLFSVKAVLSIFPALYVFFKKNPHPLPADPPEAAKKKDVNKIYSAFFINSICVLYVILGFVNNVCLIFQKNNFHYLSIHYIVDLLLIGLKNTSSASYLFIFSPNSPFCSPTPAHLQLESLAESSTSKYPTSSDSSTAKKSGGDSGDDEFVLTSHCSNPHPTTRPHRTSAVKKSLDINFDYSIDDIEEKDGGIVRVQVFSFINWCYT